MKRTKSFDVLTSDEKLARGRGGEWSSEKFYPSLEISHNLLMGLRVSDFVSVSHIFAFLSSRYTFSSRTRILKCQFWHLGESRIYHSPPLEVRMATYRSEIEQSQHTKSFNHIIRIFKEV